MSCEPIFKTFTVTVRYPVFTLAAGSDNFFVLSSEAIEQIAPYIAKVRATVKVESATDNFQATAAYQVTSDGQTWGPVPPTSIGNAVTDATPETSDWTAISNTQRGIRFGIIAGKSTGSSQEMGVVTLIIDILMMS